MQAVQQGLQHPLPMVIKVSLIHPILSNKTTSRISFISVLSE